MPTITGAMLWPWIYIIMRDVRRKFGYRANY
jgi:cell shape-determining protein MreD